MKPKKKPRNYAATADMKWREIEMELVKGQVPIPSEIKRLAEKEVPEPSFAYASDYVEAVKVLREEKGLTWDEVGRWFASRGVPFSAQALRSAYKRRESELESPSKNATKLDRVVSGLVRILESEELV